MPSLGFFEKERDTITIEQLLKSSDNAFAMSCELSALTLEVCEKFEGLSRNGPFIAEHHRNDQSTQHFGPMSSLQIRLLHVYRDYNTSKGASDRLFPAHISKKIKDAVALVLKLYPAFALLKDRVVKEQRVLGEAWYEAEFGGIAPIICIPRQICKLFGYHLRYRADENTLRLARLWLDDGTPNKIRFERAYVQFADACKRLAAVEASVNKLMKEHSKEN
ncbi:hypothetical protein BJ508DRAFT_379443 [Ascobolus immersus RN42]|uniref:Uncharacterized protein n=1 Tax=Ascobolus immersus RN42 TaxID=1160509 RepID=A0A3N4HT07_ASCIM|nr:hypothetical protein BJ508DRAFT_379443 [Ascobolus immersus RN42]